MASNPQAADLLAHIISQTKSNIDFLVSHNYISAADAEGITSKLSSLDSSNSVLALSQQTQDLTLSIPPEPTIEPTRPLSVRRSVPPTKPPTRARALWDYNENGQEPNDLSFRAGDIVEIVSETNPDWWSGKANGKQGLFPSNYVEKIAHDRPPSPPTASPRFPSSPAFPNPFGTSSPSSGASANQWQPPQGPPPNQWQPPPGPPANQWQPPPGPPANQWQPPPQNYQSPPPEQQAVVAHPPTLQPQGPEPKKKHKFGKLGSTMAQSAAGGVGFGAGAAVGSGIINAIF